MNILKQLKALAGVIGSNSIEIYTLIFIVVGLPAIAYIYVDWKLAISVFIGVNVLLGTRALRGHY